MSRWSCRPAAANRSATSCRRWSLGRTAIVISPLIALMQDQAAQLAQMGIPAAVLNSSIALRRSNRR